MSNKIIILIFTMLISFNFVYANLYNENIYGNPEPGPQLVINFVNESNISNFWSTSIGLLENVNSTQFENNGGTLNILDSWLNSFGNNLWCALTGCTMSGNIDMGNNNISNIDWINGNVNMSDNLSVNDLIVRSPSSIILGGINETTGIPFSKISAVDSALPLGNASFSRILVQINRDFLVQYPRVNGTAYGGVQNTDNSSFAFAIVDAINSVGWGFQLLKAGVNYVKPHLNMLLGHNGAMEIRTTNDSITFGFMDLESFDEDFDITAFNNLVDIIVLNKSDNSTNIMYDLNVSEEVHANDFCFNNSQCIKAKYRVKATKTDNQTLVNSGSWNNITWNTEEFDVGEMHSNTTNNQTITIKRDGLYSISYHAKVESQDKTSFMSRVLLNGNILETACDIGVGSKESSYLTLDTSYNLFELNENDNLTLQISHDHAGTLNMESANSFFQVVEEI